jgi:hypothetical protein
MYDPNAAVDNNEEDGLTFMHKHGAHGWQQQFEIRDGQSSGRSSRKQREVERGGSQDMFFGECPWGPFLCDAHRSAGRRARFSAVDCRFGQVPFKHRTQRPTCAALSCARTP